MSLISNFNTKVTTQSYKYREYQVQYFETSYSNKIFIY